MCKKPEISKIKVLKLLSRCRGATTCQSGPPQPNTLGSRLPLNFPKGDGCFPRNTPRMKSFLTALLLLGLASTGLRAAETATAPYPLTTCVVSGNDLNDMGAPIDYVYKQEGKPDRLVKLCCKQCIPKFKKDPAKYLAQLDAAEAAAAKK